MAAEALDGGGRDAFGKRADENEREHNRMDMNMGRKT